MVIDLYRCPSTLEISGRQSYIVVLFGESESNRARPLSLYRARHRGNQATFSPGNAAPSVPQFVIQKGRYTQTLRRHGSLPVEPIS